MKMNSQSNQELFNMLMKGLSEEDKKKLESILSNQAECERIMNTPEAQKLLHDLGGK
jgi:predicted membrane chloride channel (bestrophin family)